MPAPAAALTRRAACAQQDPRHQPCQDCDTGTDGPPVCDRCGDHGDGARPGEQCGRNLAGDELGGPLVADLELDAVDAAAAWVAAIDDHDAYIAATSPFESSPLPLRDSEVVATKAARKSRLFHALQEVLAVAPGEVVHDHRDRSKGTPWGPVVRVSELSVTIANHHAKGADHRVEHRHVWRDWSSLEARARAIAAAGFCTGEYQ